MEEDMSKRRKKWEEETLKNHLEKHPEWKGEFMTTSSVPINRLYSPSDISEFNYLSDLNFPSEYPFTRGVQPTMYRGRLWTMRMFSGFGTAEESNLRYKYLLEHGETGLSVAFDFPTLTIPWPKGSLENAELQYHLLRIWSFCLTKSLLKRLQHQ